MAKPIQVIWSSNAKNDVKYIYNNVLEKTKSKVYANNVKNDLIKASKGLNFVEQYQVDEYLGEPFRRIVVRHFRIIYFIENSYSIIVLEVFDNYRHPNQIRK